MIRELFETTSFPLSDRRPAGQAGSIPRSPGLLYSPGDEALQSHGIADKAIKTDA